MPQHTTNPKVTGRGAPSRSLRHPGAGDSGEPSPLRRVLGKPRLIGSVARNQDGVGPGMLRLVNLIDDETDVVHRSAIVERRLLEVWHG